MHDSHGGPIGSSSPVQHVDDMEVFSQQALLVTHITVDPVP